MPLLTHCAVRINRPKTEHVSRNQNARHELPERTTDREIEKFIIRQPPKGEKDDYDSDLLNDNHQKGKMIRAVEKSRDFPCVLLCVVQIFNFLI